MANDTLIGKAENAAYEAFERSMEDGGSLYTAIRRALKAYEAARNHELPNTKANRVLRSAGVIGDREGWKAKK